MTRRFEKNTLSLQEIASIRNDCFVQGVETKYGPPETLCAYGETGNALYIPFAYAKSRWGESPNKDYSFPPTKYEFFADKFPFRTDGGRDQEAVFRESLDILKKHRTVLLSLFCGFGKCLARGTRVLMFDGSVKPVESIHIGDLLMGDDSDPRIVTSLANGYDEMYTVVQENGDSYTVNSEHVLTLWDPVASEPVDIEIGDYLKQSDLRLLGYKVPIQFSPHKEITFDPYVLGYWLAGSTIELKTPVKRRSVREFLSRRLAFHNLYLDDGDHVVSKYYGHQLFWTISHYNLRYCKRVPDNYKITSPNIQLEILAGLLDRQAKFRDSYIRFKHESVEIVEDVVFLARSLGFRVNTVTPNHVRIFGNLSKIPLAKAYYNSTEKEDKVTYPIRIERAGRAEYYGFTLDGNGRFLLADFTVTHNTMMGIRLAQHIGVKTAVLTHRQVLVDQWIESIQKFTNATIQTVGSSGDLEGEKDFYLFNIAQVAKKWDPIGKKWVEKRLGIYKDIGLLIVDEAHIVGATEMSKALLYFNPRMLIALTATPERRDGMDKVLNLYFGDYSATRIIRIAQNEFTVYRCATGIKPEFSQNKMGGKDWNSLVDSLLTNSRRNAMILDIIQKYSDYNILLLTKRKSHCNLLAKMLKECGISNTVMVGTQDKYDKTARVLLSTYSKLGVGFDDSRLNMLILACSVKDIEQYAGRLRDAQGKNRVIIDMVDSDPNCQAHWLERRKWYQSRKGVVKNMSVVSEKEVPEEKPEREQRKRLTRKNEITE